MTGTDSRPVWIIDGFEVHEWTHWDHDSHVWVDCAIVCQKCGASDIVDEDEPSQFDVRAAIDAHECRPLRDWTPERLRETATRHRECADRWLAEAAASVADDRLTAAAHQLRLAAQFFDNSHAYWRDALILEANP